MADKSQKVPDNVPGTWFVESACTACGLCSDLHPDLFGQNDAKGWAFVRKQPATDAERAEARDAAEQCPVEAIGEDAG